jgi:peroxiredoxin/uncharacterized membrane protein YphA (DoxX/SURF4 family)
MDTALVVIRILLAAVFATAGVGKLLDIEGSRSAMRDFGLSDSLARVAGVLLPIAELATAVLLLFHPTAQIGAALALVLLLAFIAGIANALRHGMAPDCHCFGQIHSAPAGRETLVRNGVLAAMAAFVLVEGGGPAIDSWVDSSSGAAIVAVVLGIVAGLLAIFTFQLWTEVRQLRKDLATSRSQAARAAALAPPGLPVGTEAPEFAVQNLSGETVTLADLLAPGLPALLMFTSPGCGSCAEIFPSLRRWQQTLSERLTIAVISLGDVKSNQAIADEYGLQRLLVQQEGEVIESYRIRGTPSALLVNPDGTIGTIAAESVFEIEPMVRTVLRGDAATQGAVA